MRQIKVFRRILGIVLVLILTVGNLPGVQISVRAELSESGLYFYDVLEDGTVSITNHRGRETHIDIPSTIDGKDVTGIGDCIFLADSTLCSITIPDGVTSIGYCAFANCTNLREITMPDSITSIGDSAFTNCTNLREITMPDSLTSIGEHAFSSCYRLREVLIPNGVTSIGEKAFGNCRSLTSITVPSSVTSIGEDAFAGCYMTDSNFTNLSSVRDERPVMVDSDLDGFCINDYILVNARCLDMTESKVIPAGVMSIGNNAFDSCRELNSITLPNGIISIGINAFVNCTSLSSINIPNSVVYIGSSAFSNATSLSNITLPNSIVSIGNNMFSNCSSLSSITIPSSVTSIGDYAFNNCSALSSITIPSSVTSIGDNAFYSCSSLTDVYYAGNESDWESINRGNGNERLTNGTIYYTEPQPEPQPETQPETQPIIWSTPTYQWSSDNKTCTATRVSNGSPFSKEEETVNTTNCITTPATCLTNSVTKYTAQFSNTAFVTQNKIVTNIDAKGHNYITNTIKPTTKRNGSIVKKCSVCGTEEVTSIYMPKTIKLSKTSVTYNGKVQKPSVSVLDSAGNSIPKSNYTVTYKNNKKVGKATIVVAFKGIYSGSITKTFSILPKSTSLKTVKNSASKSIQVGWKKSSSVTGYQVQYSTSKKFLSPKTVTLTKTKASTIIKGLKKGKTYYVRIRNYNAVAKNKYYSEWCKAKNVKIQK